jgi:hypothetical protein
MRFDQSQISRFYARERFLRPYDKPPFGSRINWAHLLTEDLACVYLFNEPALPLLDLVRIDPAVDITGDPSITTSPYGIAVDFDGDDYIETNYAGISGAQIRTMFAIASPDVTNLDEKFFGYGIATTLGGAWDFTCEGGLRWRHGGGNITYGSVSANNWYSFAHVVPQGASTTDDAKGYIDGKEASGSRTGGTDQPIDTDSAYPLVIGQAGNTATAVEFDGKIALIYVWERDLSADEIFLLHCYPYQFIDPPLIARQFNVPAAAGPTQQSVAGTHGAFAGALSKKLMAKRTVAGAI